MADDTFKSFNSTASREDISFVEQPLADFSQARGAFFEGHAVGRAVNDANLSICDMSHDVLGLLRADCLGTREAISARYMPKGGNSAPTRK